MVAVAKRFFRIQLEFDLARAVVHTYHSRTPRPRRPLEVVCSDASNEAQLQVQGRILISSTNSYEAIVIVCKFSRI